MEKDHLNEDIVRLRAEIQTLSGDDESENGRTSKEKRWMEREVELSSSLTELKKEREVLLSRSEDAEAMCARIETELQTHRSLVASLEEDARLRESEHRVFVSSLQSTISVCLVFNLVFFLCRSLSLSHFLSFPNPQLHPLLFPTWFPYIVFKRFSFWFGSRDT